MLAGLGHVSVRDPSSRARFERQAHIGARIESDNAVEVVDAGGDEATGLPFMVMELLDGVDLDRVLDTHRRVPPQGVAGIVGQLCDALGRGHAIGVVHSDLKPESVFLEKLRRRTCGPSGGSSTGCSRGCLIGGAPTCRRGSSASGAWCSRW